MGFPTDTSDRSQLNTVKTQNLPDNNERFISPERHRTVVEVITDSCLNLALDQEFLVPEGGATQEVLIKSSNLDHETEWLGVTGIPSFQDYISNYVATNAPSPNNATYTQRGVSERATQTEVNNGTESGSTSILFVSPPELTTYVENYVANNSSEVSGATTTTSGIVEIATITDVNNNNNTGESGETVVITPSLLNSSISYQSVDFSDNINTTKEVGFYGKVELDIQFNTSEISSISYQTRAGGTTTYNTQTNLTDVNNFFSSVTDGTTNYLLLSCTFNAAWDGLASVMIKTKQLLS